MDIRSFDVNTLFVVHAILSARSVTHGSRAAGLSQPAGSNALARMRQTFGDRLLVRGRRGMTLTARGVDLLADLEEVVGRIDAMSRPRTFDPATASRTLSLAASDHATLLLLPGLVERIRMTAPLLRLSTSVFQPGSRGMPDLEKAGVDLRLGWLQDLPDTWFVRRIVDDRIGMIRRRRDTPKAELTIEEFLQADHVALATERPHHKTLADQALSRLGLSRKVAVWTTNFMSIPLMVANSDMIAFFPESLARKMEGFADIEFLPTPVSMGDYFVSMAWHPRVDNDPAYRWLRSQILEVCRDAAAPGL